MLPPLIGAILPLRDLKDEQFAIDGELLAMQDRVGVPHRRNEIGFGMRHHPEDVQLDRHSVKGRAHVSAGCLRIDQGSLAIRLSLFAVSRCDADASALPPQVTSQLRCAHSHRALTSRIGSEPSHPAATLRICSKKLPLLPLMSEISTTVPG